MIRIVWFLRAHVLPLFHRIFQGKVGGWLADLRLLVLSNFNCLVHLIEGSLLIVRIPWLAHLLHWWLLLRLTHLNRDRLGAWLALDVVVVNVIVVDYVCHILGWLRIVALRESR